MLTDLVAALIAIAIVLVAVLPARHVLRAAWARGGAAKRFAFVALAVALLLIAWVLVPGGSGSREERISDFIGAWGILFAFIGIVTIVATLLGKFRLPPSDDERR